MDIDIAYIPFLALGIAVQAFFALYGKWEKGDWKKFIGALALGLFLGIMPGKNEKEYVLEFHLILSCFLMAFFVATFFKKKLISLVSARTLVVFNVVALFLLFEKFGFSQVIIIILAIPSLVTLAAAFSNIDRYFSMQVFFYAWFSTLSIIIAVFHFFVSGLLGEFTTYEPGSSWKQIFNIFLIGTAFFYLVKSAFYVLNLNPMPGKHQTWASKKQDLKEHVQLLAHGYIWKEGDMLGNLIILLVIPVTFFLNQRFSFMDESLLITVIITTAPLLDRTSHELQSKGDGIGDLSKVE